MKIIEIIAIIEDAGLSQPPAFQRETPEALARYYNGVGPEKFHACIRRFITWALERMEPLAFIHDVEYATTKPTFWAFCVAQMRWAYNAVKIYFFSSSPRYQCHRKRFLIVAWLCALSCQLGGWWGFKAGLKKGGE